MLCGVSPRLPRTILLLLLLLHGSPAAALFVGPRVPGAPLRAAPPAFAPLTLLRSTPAAAAAALVAGTASSASAAAESGAIANQLDDRLVVGFVLVRAPAHTFTAARSFYALAPTVSPSPFRAFLSHLCAAAAPRFFSSPRPRSSSPSGMWLRTRPTCPPRAPASTTCGRSGQTSCAALRSEREPWACWRCVS